MKDLIRHCQVDQHNPSMIRTGCRFMTYLWKDYRAKEKRAQQIVQEMRDGRAVPMDWLSGNRLAWLFHVGLSDEVAARYIKAPESRFSGFGGGRLQ